MRYLTRAMIVLAALPMPSVGFAQQKSADSVDDYLCTFAGKCGGDASQDQEQVTRDAPSLKGFCLACDNRKAAAAKTPLATAQHSAAAAAPQPTRQVSRGRPTGPQLASREGNASSAAHKPSVGTHADLRLTFEYNSATLTGDARDRAKHFAEALLRPELADHHFAIEGHTDAAGTRAYNLQLSERRAQAVTDYLVSLGVSRDRLETHGYGPDRPIDGLSATSEQNRRVEAVLVS